MQSLSRAVYQNKHLKEPEQFVFQLVPCQEKLRGTRRLNRPS